MQLGRRKGHFLQTNRKNCFWESTYFKFLPSEKDSSSDLFEKQMLSLNVRAWNLTQCTNKLNVFLHSLYVVSHILNRWRDTDENQPVVDDESLDQTKQSDDVSMLIKTTLSDPEDIQELHAVPPCEESIPDTPTSSSVSDEKFVREYLSHTYPNGARHILNYIIHVEYPWLLFTSVIHGYCPWTVLKR